MVADELIIIFFCLCCAHPPLSLATFPYSVIGVSTIELLAATELLSHSVPQNVTKLEWFRWDCREGFVISPIKSSHLQGTATKYSFCGGSHSFIHSIFIHSRHFFLTPMKNHVSHIMVSSGVAICLMQKQSINIYQLLLKHLSNTAWWYHQSLPVFITLTLFNVTMMLDRLKLKVVFKALIQFRLNTF